MAVHKLNFDDAFDEVLYTLIAMHCSLEDYRLAYLLNKNLGISLKRKSEDLDYSSGLASYSIFEWEDSKQLITWNLVSNICKTQIIQKADYQSLFNTTQTKTFYLLPEYKAVNYFLKIDSEFSFSKEKFILNHILSMPQIVTAYSINTNQLQSKENLIFS
ncbi:IPExxxVDY family protein [Litoribaculum gwangyangense]|uniref:IPExxxVDY family protein n=1 Tax=Litoribaculum gwangyangense TaxID=1130722 RepID=A0ABP9BZ35_9FLAO